jgi:hypothetical protein
MPGVDLVNLILQLDKTWGMHEENTALLLETLNAQIEWAWADRTLDRDDPEVKAELAKSKGIKPPKYPVLRPVARRPLQQDEERWQDYIQSLTDAMPTPDEPWDLYERWKQQNGVAT